MLKHAPAATEDSRLTAREVIETWWPLALSWLLMIGEMPLTSAIISRLSLPEVNLAAWGIVFNLAVMIQAPGTMLLAASTAMVVDAVSYLRLRRIAFSILAVLTLMHVLIGFTPLFDLVLRDLLGLPPEVVDASRMAMMLVVPWSFGTGTRRFFHGILIRYGQSRAVIVGTLVRLTADIVILGAGLMIGSIEGATLTAAAMTAAVLLEALYAWLRVRPVIRDQVLTNTANRMPFTYADFARFYTPLVVTTLLSLSTVTLISAALARMPGSLASLATWPVVFGFLMLWQSVAFAYQEVVISMLRRPGAVEVLLKVTKQLALGVTLVLGAALITPLAYWWFHSGAALSAELTALAQGALLLGLFIPALRAIQSWQQGTIVYGRNTGPMLESVVVFLAVTAGVLALGMSLPLASGLYAGMAAYALGMAAQTAWLAIRIRPLLVRLRERDVAAAP